MAEDIMEENLKLSLFKKKLGWNHINLDN